MDKVQEVSETNTEPLQKVKLEGVLKKYRDIFDGNNSLKSKLHPIWKKIKDAESISMKAESLFLYVFNNRNNCQHNLRSHFEIPVPKNVKRKRDELLYKPTTGKKALNRSDCPPLEFKIECLKNDIFAKDENGKLKVKSYWMDNVVDKMVEAQNLPCVFCLENKWFVQDGFKFKCYCSVKECSCTLEGQCNDLNKEALQFTIETHDCSNIDHRNKKRQLRGKRLENARSNLVHQTASEYRENQLAKLPKNIKKEPVTISNVGTLRKARQKKIDSLLNYDDFKSKSLTNRKFIEHCGIRLLSLSPFYMFYCTDDQIKLWNEVCDEKLPLSFDDTGSLVKRYSAYGIKSKNIFYYAIVIGIKGAIIPVMQALLSIQHVLIVVQILQKWRECGAKIPKEISADGSRTLHNAMNLAFNNETLQMYNLHCFRALVDPSIPLPRCQCREDVAHQINSFIHWSSFKNVDPDMAGFYVRIMGYLIQVENLKDFESVMHAVIIVSNSTYSPKESECAKKKQQLKNLVKTYDINCIEYQSPICCEVNNVTKVETTQKCNELIEFVDSIYKRALDACTNDDNSTSPVANFLYNPDFSKDLKRFAYNVASNTNIMNNSFETPNPRGNSSRSETNFGTQKRRIPMPTSIMKFTLKDKNCIDGRVVDGLIKWASMQPKIKSNEARDTFNLDKLDLHTVEVPASATNLLFELLNSGKETIGNELLKSAEKTTINQASMCENSTGSADQSLSIKISQTNGKMISNKDVNFISCSNNASSEKVIQKTVVNEAVHSVGETNLCAFHSEISENRVITYSRQLIKNGGRIGEKDYCFRSNDRCKIRKCTFSLTCPVDSSTEVIVDMYLRNKEFRLKVHDTIQSENQHFFKIIVEYCSNFNINHFYQRRAEYLYPLVRDKIDESDFQRHKITYKCNMNIVNVVERCMIGYPSFLERRQCFSCTANIASRSTFSVSPTVYQFHLEGIKNLQSHIDDYFEERALMACSDCKADLNRNTVKTFWEFNEYFVIDLEYLSEKKNESAFKFTNPAFKNHPFQYKTDFNNIPKNLDIKGNIFKLKSTICFCGDATKEETISSPTSNSTKPKKPQQPRSVSHYYSYILDSDEQWVMYNDENDTIRAVNTVPNEKLALIFYLKD